MLFKENTESTWTTGRAALKCIWENELYLKVIIVSQTVSVKLSKKLSVYSTISTRGEELSIHDMNNAWILEISVIWSLSNESDR